MTATTILIVDDEPQIVDLLQEALSFSFDRCLRAENGKIALDLTRRELPDVILLDLMMPVMNGYQALLALQADDQMRDIPVIFLSAAGEMDSKITALHAGAVDYITKPFNLDDLEARLQVAVRRKQDLDRWKQKVIMDELTGLHQRSFFLQRLEEVYQAGDEVSCLVLNIDQFTRFNIRYGVPVGDLVLQSVAATLRATVAAPALVARTGSDEFAILLPHMMVERALRIGEDILARVSPLPGTDLPAGETITLSAGIAARPPRPSRFQPATVMASGLLAQATAALHHARRSAKNIMTATSQDDVSRRP